VLFRLVRNGEVIDHGRIVSLKHVDKDIKEAKEGTECGMKLEISTPVQEKDVLEVYARELKRKED
jgi:translation initiation factor IF-2